MHNTDLSPEWFIPCSVLPSGGYGAVTYRAIRRCFHRGNQFLLLKMLES
jgi:hypothetical protein